MSSESVVTPAGVRDGEPDALRGLVARRGPAVLAYCAAVCDPLVAPRAAAEALARFRGAVAAASEPGALAPEPLLIGATRHSAASMARIAPQGGSGLRRVLGDRGASETCALVPTLLAAQADAMLSPEDQDKLRRHLDRHPACRTIEAGFRQAEARYADPPDRPIPPATERLLLHALVAAAPLAPGVDASDVLDWGVTEEEDALVAAQETQDWAAADVAAAVAMAEATAAQPEPEPEPEPQPEPEPEVVVAEQADLELAHVVDEDGLLDEDEGEGEGEDEALVFEDELEDDEDLVDADEHDLTTVIPAVEHPAASPSRSLRERLHLPGEHDHGPFFRFILPGALIVLGLLLAMLLAGVFDDGDGPRAARPDPASAAMPTAAPVTSSAIELSPTTRTSPASARPRPKRRRSPATATVTSTTPARPATPATSPATPAATPVPTPAPRRTAAPKRRASAPDTDAEKTEQTPSLPGAQTTATSPADEPVFTPGETQP